MSSHLRAQVHIVFKNAGGETLVDAKKRLLFDSGARPSVADVVAKCLEHVEEETDEKAESLRARVMLPDGFELDPNEHLTDLVDDSSTTAVWSVAVSPQRRKRVSADESSDLMSKPQSPSKKSKLHEESNRIPYKVVGTREVKLVDIGDVSTLEDLVSAIAAKEQVAITLPRDKEKPSHSTECVCELARKSAIAGPINAQSKHLESFMTPESESANLKVVFGGKIHVVHVPKGAPPVLYIQESLASVPQFAVTLKKTVIMMSSEKLTVGTENIPDGVTLHVCAAHIPKTAMIDLTDSDSEEEEESHSVVVHLFAGAVPIYVTAESKHALLSDLGLDSESQLTIFFRPTAPALAETAMPSDDSVEKMFAIGSSPWSSSWQPIIKQTRAGLSCFLSCLYALRLATFKFLKDRDLDVTSFVEFLASDSRFSESPCFLLLLFKVVSKRKLMEQDKCLLATLVFNMMKEVVPADLTKDRVFEVADVFFADLWSRFETWISSAADSSSQTTVEIFALSCQHSNMRLEDPVRIGAQLFSRASVLPHIRGGPLFVPGGLFSSVQPDALVRDKQIQLLLLTHPAPVVEAIVITVVDRSESADEADVEEEDGPEPWIVWKAKARMSKVFGVIPPANLAAGSPVSLTRGSEGPGDMIVFVGSGGEDDGCGGRTMNGSLNFYSPTRGSEVSLDPKKVVQELDAAFPKGDARRAELTIFDQRPPDECIVVCLDVSTSMCSASGFKDAVADMSKVVVEEWGGFSNKPGKKVVVDDSDDDDEEEAESSSAVTSDELNVLKLHPNLDDIVRTVKAAGLFHETNVAKAILVDLATTRLAGWGDYYDRNEVKVKKFVESEGLEAAAAKLIRFCKDLETGSGGIQGGKGRDVPSDFLCPITMCVMRDPVTLKDGTTYERSAITSWLAGKLLKTSPLTGVNLGYAPQLTENRALKNIINQWYEGPVQSQKFAYAVTVNFKNHKSALIESVVVPVVSSAVTIAEFRREVTRKTHGRYPDYALFDSRLQYRSFHATSALTLAQCGLVVTPETPEPNVTALLSNTQSVKPKLCRFFNGTDVFIDLLVGSCDTFANIKYRLIACFASDGRFFWPKMLSRIFLAFKRVMVGDGFHNIYESGWSANVFEYCTPENTSLAGEFPEILESIRVPVQSTPPADFVYYTFLIRERPVKGVEEIDRLTAVKQLFNAFTDRTHAYGLMNHIGLILFGSTADLTQNLTPVFENFRDSVENARPNGETRLWDAVEKAVDALDAYCKTEFPNVPIPKRIIAITDGKDTKSSVQPLPLAKKLLKGTVTLDSVIIGRDFDAELKGISKATGGYSFQPATLNAATSICELEVFLSQSERPVSAQPARLQSLTKFLKMPFDECDPQNQVVPARKKDMIKAKGTRESQINQAKTLNLESSLNNADRTKTSTISTLSSAKEPSHGLKLLRHSRVLKEMRALLSKPHPEIDIYPCEEDMTIWRIVMCGPKDTIYGGAVFLATLTFPEGYPVEAPTFRFDTPIRHCNVNTYGKVCHSVLSQAWTLDTTASQILDCVFGLLLVPDVDNPIDSVLALMSYDDSGKYEATILQHTALYAKSVSRETYRKRSESGKPLDG
ncbi:hypothetical protein HDU98_007670, partial [Podochytrium sp. JEL0797]